MATENYKMVKVDGSYRVLPTWSDGEPNQEAEMPYCDSVDELREELQAMLAATYADMVDLDEGEYEGE